MQSHRESGGAEGPDSDVLAYHRPVFVLTNHAREPLVKGETSFTFVTDGIESALEQARAAAGDGEISIAGGANVIQQYLAAGLVDEFQVHISPILLRRGAAVRRGPGIG